MQNLPVRICMLLLLPLCGMAQTKKSGDTLTVSFLMKDTVIADTSQMKLQVVYRNNTSREIDMYRELRESDHGYNWGNIVFEIKNTGNREWGYRSACAPAISQEFFLTDSLRHFDLPKKKLAPFSSDTLQSDLMEYFPHYPPGNYQVKAFLRVKTIPDQTVYDDPNGEKGQMPYDTIVYLESDWIDFQVRKTVSRIRNEDGTLREVSSVFRLPEADRPDFAGLLFNGRVRLRQNIPFTKPE